MAYEQVKAKILLPESAKNKFFTAKTLRELKKAGENFTKANLSSEITQLNTELEDINVSAQDKYFLSMALNELENIDEPESTGGSGGTTTVNSNETVITDKSVPVGTILPHYSTVVPDGWLECNGANVSRTEYTDLFVTIGTTAGNGDGSTTFTLPDLRGSFLRGYGISGGTALNPNWGDAGRTVGSVQDDENKSHHHDMRLRRNPGQYGTGWGNVINLENGSPTRTWSDDWSIGGHPDQSMSITATGGVESRPKNIAVNYIIKAKKGSVQGGGIADMKDYEEGIFVPVFVNNGGWNNWGTLRGYYTKLGNRIDYWGAFTDPTGTPNNNALALKLPYKAKSEYYEWVFVGHVHGTHIGSDGDTFSPRIYSDDENFGFLENSNKGDNWHWLEGIDLSTATNFIFHISYLTDGTKLC